MEIKIENLSPVKKRIRFEITADRVAQEIDKAYENIRKRASIKGFRKGKAPQAYIEKHYSDVMSEDVLKSLVNDTYFQGLTDHKIYPVSHPEIESDELKRGESFSYSATVEVFPDIDIKDYVGLEVQKEKFVLDNAVIDRRLQEMQESLGQLQPVPEGQAAVKGDFVTMDFKGFVDGVPFEGGEATDFVLEIGSNRFIPGFEDQLCGMKSGEEKEIKVTFPVEYGKKELAGKEATFAVTVKEVKAKNLPPLDDDFAKEFGDFETLAQLREKLTEGHEKQERDRIESDLRDRLIKALIDRNGIEVPDSLVDKQLQIMLDNTKKRLAYQRLSLEMMGMTEEGYLAQFRSTATTQVQGSLLLEALAIKEEIKAGDSDLEEKIASIAGDARESLDTVRNYYRANERARENLLAQIREERALDFLLDKAKVTEVSRDEITQKA
jgi:trigger factor